MSLYLIPREIDQNYNIWDVQFYNKWGIPLYWIFD